MDETESVRRIWQSLGLPGIVDVHTHFMPKPVMDKVWQYFDRAGPLVGRRWPIAYRTDEEQRLRTLRGFGVRAFTSLLYPHKPQMAAWLNRWAAAFAAATPDCLHTATLYPEPGVENYVRKAIDLGARLFKVHIQVGRFSPTDPLLDKAWGGHRRRRRPRRHPLRLRSRPGRTHGRRARRGAAGPPSSPALGRRTPGYARVHGLPQPCRSVRRRAIRHHHGVHPFR